MRLVTITILVLIIILFFIAGFFFIKPVLMPVEKTGSPETSSNTQEQEKNLTESPEKLSCSDECQTETCIGYNYSECSINEEGCKQEIGKGLVKGKCGVECFFNSDCDAGKECLSYKCQEAKSGLDLADIPEPFLTDTWVVVGANAPSMDIMSAIEVTTMLQKETGTKTDAKLDSDIAGQESSHNLILIGSPCDNKAVEKVSDITCEGFQLDDGKAVIKIFSNGKTFLLIAGKTAQDTLRAAKRVAAYESNDLEGTEMIL